MYVSTGTQSANSMTNNRTRHLLLLMSQLPSCDGHRLNIYEYMVESLSYPTVPVLEVESWGVTSFRHLREKLIMSNVPVPHTRGRSMIFGRQYGYTAGRHERNGTHPDGRKRNETNARTEHVQNRQTITNGLYCLIQSIIYL